MNYEVWARYEMTEYSVLDEVEGEYNPLVEGAIETRYDKMAACPNKFRAETVASALISYLSDFVDIIIRDCVNEVDTYVRINGERVYP